MLVDIPISDAVDKLTILQIKAYRLAETELRISVVRELEDLRKRLQHVAPKIACELDRLAEVNRQLWGIKEDLRRLEAAGDFGDEFVQLARLVYITNDEREAIKQEIDAKCKARFLEDEESEDKEYVVNRSDLKEQHIRTTLPIAEWGVSSQNGEDGVIESLMTKVGTTNRFYVEFGCGDGTECNTAYLASCGWQGLLMDDIRLPNPVLEIHSERVTAENINALLDKYNVPVSFDLLSIDIDGNDYWVWKAIERSPRVVVIEYNAHIPPNQSRVIKYDPHFAWNGTDYFGASLRALVELAASKSYTLVYCEATGTNAFFLRNDLLPNEGVTADIEKLYRPPNYLNQGLSWPRDPYRTMIAPN